MEVEKFTLGMGDRFARQGRAQLRAILQVVREIHAGAHGRFDELTGPYATVIDVKKDLLPAPETVPGWSSGRYVKALRHDPACPEYNANFRQFVHVGFKVAAEMGPRYLVALAANGAVIARHVTHNLFALHLQPIFGQS